MMMMLLLLQQKRMESHLGLREQLIDLLSLFETHLEREAMQRAAVAVEGSHNHDPLRHKSGAEFISQLDEKKQNTGNDTESLFQNHRFFPKCRTFHTFRIKFE